MNHIDIARPHLRRINAMFTRRKEKERSLVFSAWKKLKPGEKRFVLIAAGIPDNSLTLTNSELRLIGNAISRLKNIVNAFALCNEQDFGEENEIH